MTVIPFDHGRRRSPGGSSEPEARVTIPDELSDVLSVPTEPPTTLQAACLRIDTLERALITALRENATNWARAEYAEQRLMECGVGPRAGGTTD